ncbi:MULTISPECIES: flagellar hook-basal body complex protein FliE [Paenibacillus]|uniref:flagellar hook-basal body complex protein FliE n=1 Tax=Paenibacillus TaxID=44249 RepID=UPI0004F70D62|nr:MULTISPECIES: flagellar hook-basal body complex protein FliE [unclassified Paenibacillus]AIQ30521.1 flagellar hook-basal body protein FliE [Paenibacillus sp. FSL P4-0081]KHL96472.1 flagellar hook-basal body protein FliE [Paenibacillus sp. IHB B 3415]OMF23663.1 flagellar hook-basal body complex protein FliE [Paenibacillus sp. FSL H8-0259]
MIQNLLIGTQAVQPLAMKPVASEASAVSETGQSFGSYLENALNQVADQEQQAKDMSNKFVLGEVNIDEAMISSQQALLSLQLTTQVRNKVIEAYQEIMRTQI